MGWESLHLYLFQIRAAAYGSFQLSVESPDATMESFRFRKNAKFTYVGDGNQSCEKLIQQASTAPETPSALIAPTGTVT